MNLNKTEKNSSSQGREKNQRILNVFFYGFRAKKRDVRAVIVMLLVPFRISPMSWKMSLSLSKVSTELSSSWSFFLWLEASFSWPQFSVRVFFRKALLCVSPVFKEAQLCWHLGFRIIFLLGGIFFQSEMMIVTLLTMPDCKTAKSTVHAVMSEDCLHRYFKIKMNRIVCVM